MYQILVHLHRRLIDRITQKCPIFSKKSLVLFKDIKNSGKKVLHINSLHLP